MIWFAQLAEPTPGVWDYILKTAGPYGILIIFLVVALVYYVKKSDKAEKSYQDEKDKRLQDTKDFALLTRQPVEELTKFVRTLYDGYNGRSKDT